MKEHTYQQSTTPGSGHGPEIAVSCSCGWKAPGRGSVPVANARPNILRGVWFAHIESDTIYVEDK